jgi:BirA family transcriptional regulator, biotin operon repressor / biotin---[acetyl-CoA-carboxylase] ligase
MRKLGHKIERMDAVASTNSLVLATERYIGLHGFVLVARRQPAGRGRLGRTWHDLPGEQLFASIVVHPRVSAADTPAISLIAGLAVAQALADVAGVAARLKWPNDVTIQGRKVTGILVESSPGAGGATRLVVGVGVNCQGTTQDLPPELRDRITTVSQEAGWLVAPDAVLSALLARLEVLLARLHAGEKVPLLIEWARAAHVAGRWLRFPVPGGETQGITQGITPEGYLVVEDVSGMRHILVSGEATWRD